MASLSSEPSKASVDLDAQPAGRQLPSALTPALPPAPGWSHLRLLTTKSHL